MRILIVGESIPLEESFSAQISYSEYNNTAQRILETGDFDVVITRQFDDLEALITDNVPVIFLTGDPQQAALALDRGVHDVVVGTEDTIKALLPAMLRKVRRQFPLIAGSDAHYRLLVRNLPDMAIMLFDRDLRFLVAEGEPLERNGYKKADIEGKCLHEIVPPESYQELLPMYEATLSGQSFDKVIERENGIFETRFLPLKDQPGDPTMGMVIIKDVTEVRQYENLLQQTHENFVMLIQNVDIGIMLMDEETEILLNNDIALELLGVRTNKLRGLRCIDLELDMVREDGTPITKEEMPIVVALRDLKSIQNQVIGVYNPIYEKRVWLMCSVVPQMNIDGTLRHAVCSFSDITPLKEAREALYNSMSQYRLLADNINDVISLHDTSGTFLYISPSVTRTTGWMPDELIGTSGMDLVHPDDLDLSIASNRELTEFGRDSMIEWRCKAKGGSYKWLETYSHRVYDHAAGEYRLVSSSRDITKRRETEAKLRRQSEMRKMLNDVLRVFIDKDYETAMIETLSAIGKFSNSDRVQYTEINGATFSILYEWCRDGVPPIKHLRQNLPVDNLLSLIGPYVHGKPTVIEAKTLPDFDAMRAGASQTKRPSSQTTTAFSCPVIDHGTLVGGVNLASLEPREWSEDDADLLQFIAEIIVMGRRRHQYENELVHARDVAETANRAKSAFLANMSHELRTPLNAILGFAQLFERDKQLSTSQRENISVIARSGEHLLDLINDVLEMSKIEVGRAQLIRRPFDLNRLVESLTAMLRLRAEAKGLTFEVIWEEDVPRYILGDERKLRQILINLIGNAIKYTGDGGVLFNICLNKDAPPPDTMPDSKLRSGSSDLAPVVVTFKVEDTGYGISEHEFPLLFEAFRQTESGKMVHEGSGLGLSISREYVQLMGGDILVESEPGSGSVFTFSIPVQPVSPEDAISDEDVRRVTSLEAGQPAYRIMVVEDRKENRMLIERLLRGTGFTVIEAIDGVQAVEKFKASPPDLIFMDLRMPNMDGYEAMRRIRALPEGKEIVIIALTASVFDSEEDHLLAIGFDAMIRKPFRQRVIFEAISRFLGARYVYEIDEAPNGWDSTAERLSGLKPVPPRDLNSAVFSMLPNDLIGKLHKSARKADHAEVLSLIHDISHYNKDIANYVAELMNDFDFEKLVKVTQR